MNTLSTRESSFLTINIETIALVSIINIITFKKNPISDIPFFCRDITYNISN